LYNISAGKSVYQRRLFLSLMKTPGTPLCNEVKAYTSVLQLLEDVKAAPLPSLAFAGINFSFDEYPFMSLHTTFFQSFVGTGGAGEIYCCQYENVYAGARRT
jgi:hypothetical protein